MILNRRDFLKTAGAIAGSALAGSPAEALEAFDKLAKFHKLTDKQKNIVKNIREKYKLTSSELSSVFGWVEKKITPLQIKQLINFSREGIGQQGIKEIVKEFERGELIPENGFEINYVSWVSSEGKDKIELIKFEKQGKVYHQFIYNLDDGIKNKMKTSVLPESDNKNNEVSTMEQSEYDHLKKVNHVSKKILKELTWLRSMDLALPPKYLCQKIIKKSDNDDASYDYIELGKANETEKGEEMFLSTIEIAADKISIYDEGAKKQVDLVNVDGRVKIIFHPSGNNEDWEDIYAKSEVKGILKDFFNNKR